MIEQYVDWLVKVYAARFGHQPEEEDILARATRILRYHADRMPSHDEFVSLVAAEVAVRINADEASPEEPFLQTLERAADAVRHRVIREARRWHTNLSFLNEVPSPPRMDEAAFERIKTELLEGLSVEEHIIAERILEGEPIGKLARQLNVSRRTLQRRLAEIRLRIGMSSE